MIRHVTSPENQAAIQDLIATSLKVAKDRIADQKLMHPESLWLMVVKQQLEAHAERVLGIERYFRQLEIELALNDVPES